MIDDFVDRNYSLAGAWEINKRAFGKDLVRAPANLAWAPFYLLSQLGGSMAAKAGRTDLASRLKSLPAGFKTDVEREVAWRLYSEFLELPFDDGERLCAENALLTHVIMSADREGLLNDAIEPFKELESDKALRQRLEKSLLEHIDNRKEVAELATVIVSTAAGLAATKTVNMGAGSLGQTAASVVAYNTAVSNFVLGPTLGRLYYSYFAGGAAASTGLIIGMTAGIVAAMGVIAALAGVVTDPIQRRAGLHRRKLRRLVDQIEEALLNDEGKGFILREGFITRLLDALDMLVVVARTRS